MRSARRQAPSPPASEPDPQTLVVNGRAYTLDEIRDSAHTLMHRGTPSGVEEGLAYALIVALDELERCRGKQRDHVLGEPE